jgi:hypothetical protein
MSVTLGVNMSSSSATRPFIAIFSDCKRDLYTKISTNCRDLSMETTKLKPSIKGTIDSNLHLESFNYTLNNLRLRFYLFGPFMLK